MEQQAVAELPVRLDQRSPGVRVAHAVGRQTVGVLEGAHCLGRGVAVDARPVPDRREAGNAEAVLQVEDRVAGGIGRQREGAARNSSSSCNS